jgi:hypothetical protein
MEAAVGNCKLALSEPLRLTPLAALPLFCLLLRRMAGWADACNVKKAPNRMNKIRFISKVLSSEYQVWKYLI